LQVDLLTLVGARRGHFLLESGHHGDLWLNLELLCLRPRLVQPFAVELSGRLSRLGIDAVCGPLVEGAFVGLMVASELDVDFTYTERFAQTAERGLFPIGYRVPDALRAGLRNKRVAIMNDVINAGSAVRGTFAALAACGAMPVAMGTLLVLGTAASAFAASNNLALETIAAISNTLWAPSDCPWCVSGIPLEDAGGFGMQAPASRE
jgi:orotate phosphoribosyltransferase